MPGITSPLLSSLCTQTQHQDLSWWVGLDSRHTGHGWELVARTEGDTELRSEVAQAALCCVLLRIALCCIGQWSWSLSLHDRAEKLRRTYGGVRKFLVFVRSAPLTRISALLKNRRKSSLCIERVLLNVECWQGRSVQRVARPVDIKYTSPPYKVRQSGGAGPWLAGPRSRDATLGPHWSSSIITHHKLEHYRQRRRQDRDSFGFVIKKA